MASRFDASLTNARGKFLAVFGDSATLHRADGSTVAITTQARPEFAQIQPEQDGGFSVATSVRFTMSTAVQPTLDTRQKITWNGAVYQIREMTASNAGLITFRAEFLERIVDTAGDYVRLT